MTLFCVILLYDNGVRLAGGPYGPRPPPHTTGVLYTRQISTEPSASSAQDTRLCQPPVRSHYNGGFNTFQNIKQKDKTKRFFFSFKEIQLIVSTVNHIF